MRRRRRSKVDQADESNRSRTEGTDSADDRVRERTLRLQSCRSPAKRVSCIHMFKITIRKYARDT